MGQELGQNTRKVATSPTLLTVSQGISKLAGAHFYLSQILLSVALLDKPYLTCVFGFAFDAYAVVFLLLAFQNSCELYRTNKQTASERANGASHVHQALPHFVAGTPSCHMSLIICCNFCVAVN